MVFLSFRGAFPVERCGQFSLPQRLMRSTKVKNGHGINDIQVMETDIEEPSMEMQM